MTLKQQILKRIDLEWETTPGEVPSDILIKMNGREIQIGSSDREEYISHKSVKIHIKGSFSHGEIESAFREIFPEFSTEETMGFNIVARMTFQQFQNHLLAAKKSI